MVYIYRIFQLALYSNTMLEENSIPNEYKAMPYTNIDIDA